MKEIIALAFGGVTLAAVTLFLVIVALEFIVGCGGHYTDASGVIHGNVCLFVPE
jgi:hypothetical protein